MERTAAFESGSSLTPSASQAAATEPDSKVTFPRMGFEYSQPSKPASKPAPAKPATATGAYQVQVGAFSTEARAAAAAKSIGGTVATNAAGPATFKHGTTRNWIDGLTVVLASGDVLDIRRGDTVADEEGHFEIQIGARTVRVPVPSYRMPRVSKLSAGYFAEPGMDLVDLFIGAEGTLGIVTAATLRVSRVRPATAMRKWCLK